MNPKWQVIYYISPTGNNPAVISRVEAMNSNPSLNLLKRLASALGVKLKIAFE